MRVSGRSARRARRSTESARWEPRLLGATACSSSRMSVRALLSAFRPRSEVRRMKSDSGVVMRTCGGLRAWRARSFWGVSPVRTATRISGRGAPPCSAAARISSSGAMRLRWTSFASAFRGET